MGKYDKALADFNKALELNSNNAEAYENRGLIYYHEKKYSQALDEFNKAIELRNDNAEPYFSRSLTYEKLSKTQEAADDLNKALELNPQLADGLLIKGRACYYFKNSTTC